MLFSVKPQHESAIGIHISPPFWTSLPSPSPSHPSRLLQSPCLSSLRHTANSHWLSILYMISVNFHVTLSIHLRTSQPWLQVLEVLDLLYYSFFSLNQHFCLSIMPIVMKVFFVIKQLYRTESENQILPTILVKTEKTQNRFNQGWT